MCSPLLMPSSGPLNVVFVFQIDNRRLCLDLQSAPVIVSQLTSEGKWKSKDKSRYAGLWVVRLEVVVNMDTFLGIVRLALLFNSFLIKIVIVNLWIRKWNLLFDAMFSYHHASVYYCNGAVPAVDQGYKIQVVKQCYIPWTSLLVTGLQITL